MACGFGVARWALVRSRDGRSKYRRHLGLGHCLLQRDGRPNGKPMLRRKGHPVREQFPSERARTVAATCIAAVVAFVLVICRCQRTLVVALAGGRSNPFQGVV